MKKQKLSGFMMAVIGFVLIVINALNYIFGWEMGATLGVIGIVFLAVGMKTIKKFRK
jgi:hypothetical protein